MIIELAFFRAEYGGFFSKAIKFKDRKIKGIHSHVEMIFPQYTIEDPHKGRQLSLCYSAYESEGGVRFKFIYLNPEKWDRVEIDIPNEKFDELLAEAAKHADAKYDWAGIFGFVLPWVNEKPGRFFCSEIQVYLFQKVLKTWEDLIPHKTSPSQLYAYVMKKHPLNQISLPLK